MSNDHTTDFTKLRAEAIKNLDTLFKSVPVISPEHKMAIARAEKAEAEVERLRSGVSEICDHLEIYHKDEALGDEVLHDLWCLIRPDADGRWEG